MRLAYVCRPRASANLQTLKEAVACEHLFRIICSEFRSPPLRVMQANTWQQITFTGSKPSARYDHVAAWSDAADGLYIHGGTDGSVGAQQVRRVRDQRI